MKASCKRLLRRRSVSTSTPRARIRQQAERMRDLYELEAALELSRPNLDIDYLLRLDLESKYVLDVLASIGRRA